MDQKSINTQIHKLDIELMCLNRYAISNMCFSKTFLLLFYFYLFSFNLISGAVLLRCQEVTMIFLSRWAGCQLFDFPVLSLSFLQDLGKDHSLCKFNGTSALGIRTCKMQGVSHLGQVAGSQESQWRNTNTAIANTASTRETWKELVQQEEQGDVRVKQELHILKSYTGKEGLSTWNVTGGWDAFEREM